MNPPQDDQPPKKKGIPSPQERPDLYDYADARPLKALSEWSEGDRKWLESMREKLKVKHDKIKAERASSMAGHG